MQIANTKVVGLDATEREHLRANLISIISGLALNFGIWLKSDLSADINRFADCADRYNLARQTEAERRAKRDEAHRAYASDNAKSRQKRDALRAAQDEYLKAVSENPVSDEQKAFAAIYAEHASALVALQLRREEWKAAGYQGQGEVFDKQNQANIEVGRLKKLLDDASKPLVAQFELEPTMVTLKQESAEAAEQELATALDYGTANRAHQTAIQFLTAATAEIDEILAVLPEALVRSFAETAAELADQQSRIARAMPIAITSLDVASRLKYSPELELPPGGCSSGFGLRPA